MMRKTVMITTIAILFISTSVLSVSAQISPVQKAEIQEVSNLEYFMNDVEHIASESQTYYEFIQILGDRCTITRYQNCTMIQELFSKILLFLMKDRGAFISGINIGDFLTNFSLRCRSDYFVISYGVYNRINPFKDNSFHIFKIGISIWHYSDTLGLLKGRTLILEKQPFGIHQKMIGSQLGFMTGFKGIYLDVESKISQNSYVIFIGHVDRISVFELPSPSQ